MISSRDLGTTGRAELQVKDFNRKAREDRKGREISQDEHRCFTQQIFLKSSCAKRKVMAFSNIFLRKDAQFGGFHN